MFYPYGECWLRYTRNTKSKVASLEDQLSNVFKGNSMGY